MCCFAQSRFFSPDAPQSSVKKRNAVICISPFTSSSMRARLHFRGQCVAFSIIVSNNNDFVCDLVAQSEQQMLLARWNNLANKLKFEPVELSSR